MRIVETWEDSEKRVYAIVYHSEPEQFEFNSMPFEAIWELDGELQDFAGGPGHRIGDDRLAQTHSGGATPIRRR